MKMNQRGQTSVEYVLVLGVVLLLTMTVIKSNRFKSLVSGDGDVFQGYKNYMEYTYRHAYFDLKDSQSNYGAYTGNHNSYTQDSGIDTRFFLVRNPYGL